MSLYLPRADLPSHNLFGDRSRWQEIPRGAEMRQRNCGNVALLISCERKTKMAEKDLIKTGIAGLDEIFLRGIQGPTRFWCRAPPVPAKR